MIRARSVLLAALVALTFGWGLAQGMAPGEHHGMPAAAPMDAGMMTPIEDEADFLGRMTLHHQEAVDSAKQLLERSERPEVRALAQAIIEAQEQEIATMRGWLEAWYPDREREVAYQPMMRDLAGLSPDEADRAFIEDMIEHHRMAVMEARQLLERDLAEHEDVAAMARDIIEVQLGEIAKLQGWLREGFGADQSAAGMPGLGMMGMHEMMRQCAGMMDQNYGSWPGMNGWMAPGMAGMMDLVTGPQPRYDQQAAQALARAFLAGQQPEAEITGIEAPRTLYRVTFRNGGGGGVLIVDAATGEVRLEQGE